jgi:hypothetical protein
VLLVEVKCRKSGHEDGDDGIVYVENLKVVDLFELAGDYGRDLLKQTRSIYLTGAATANGEVQLDGLGDGYYTDGSGVVLTPAEVAERRGDGRPVVLVSEAVVEYDDGSALLWPMDYVDGEPRPAVGDVANDGATVTDLLNTRTGESLVHGVADDVAAAAAFGANLDDGVPQFGDYTYTVTTRTTDHRFDEFATLPIAKLAEALFTVADLDDLRTIRAGEEAHKNRSGALAAIDARIAALQSTIAAEAHPTGADGEAW